MQPFVDFGQRTVFKDYFFNHPLDTFLNFSFFCPQPKAEADSFICASFLVVCHLLVLMLRCDYISSFLCSSVFFLYSHEFVIQASVDCTSRPMPWWGYCGNTVNSVCCKYIYFFGNSFFSYYAKINNQSFFFGC